MLLLVDFFTSVVKALLKSVPLSKRPFLYWTWLTMDKILLDGNLNILMIKSQICWSEELSYKCSFCACSFVQLMAQITNAAPFKGSIAIFFADDESKSSVKCAWFVDGCSFFWDAPPISLCTQRPLNKQNCLATLKMTREIPHAHIKIEIKLPKAVTSAWLSRPDSNL